MHECVALKKAERFPVITSLYLKHPPGVGLFHAPCVITSVHLKNRYIWIFLKINMKIVKIQTLQRLKAFPPLASRSQAPGDATRLYYKCFPSLQSLCSKHEALLRSESKGGRGRSKAVAFQQKSSTFCASGGKILDCRQEVVVILSCSLALENGFCYRSPSDLTSSLQHPVSGL